MKIPSDEVNSNLWTLEAQKIADCSHGRQKRRTKGRIALRADAGFPRTEVVARSRQLSGGRPALETAGKMPALLFQVRDGGYFLLNSSFFWATRLMSSFVYVRAAFLKPRAVVAACAALPACAGPA